ncbi:uncharacterized protein (DUF983 family) [Mesonia hippocampi]|uniref:Uncharacterized protein (DUF983 family) n=1 Tax=Mesonia hippocampi TaxID=1628250 RepID=A0A840EWI5_9FLAO|nr:DUF983 domain-containing protein [Mesonia hippocampi]MBB4119197.1 uncharacterized protein (DUF983 family) [Mesonia hippocampi]
MSKITNILKCKCPNCQEGDMYEHKGSIFLLKMPKMKKYCDKCNFKFEIETGFFYGAMYVSYSLACAEMITSLVIFWYFMGLSPLNVFLVVVIATVLLSVFNYRLSRVIWLYIFYKKQID